MARVNAVTTISITSPAREKNPNLQVYVVFTDLEATKAALEAASHLARDLSGWLVLLFAKVVPYPLPLEAPPVASAFTAGFTLTPLRLCPRLAFGPVDPL